MEKRTATKIRIAVIVIAATGIFAILIIIGAGCHLMSNRQVLTDYNSPPAATIKEATVRTIERTVYRRNTLEMAAIVVGAFGVVLCFTGSPLAGGGLIAACIFTICLSSAMTMYPRAMAATGVILVLGAGSWATFLIATKTKIADGFKRAFGQIVTTVEVLKKELPVEKVESLFGDNGPIKNAIQSATTSKLVKQFKDAKLKDTKQVIVKV